MPEHKLSQPMVSNLDQTFSTKTPFKKLQKKSTLPAPLARVPAFFNPTCVGDADVCPKGCKCCGLALVPFGDKGEEERNNQKES